MEHYVFRGEAYLLSNISLRSHQKFLLSFFSLAAPSDRSLHLVLFHLHYGGVHAGSAVYHFLISFIIHYVGKSLREIRRKGKGDPAR